MCGAATPIKLFIICIIVFIIPNIFNYGISVITVANKWIYKYQFLVPLSELILFVLHTPKPANIDVIVIYNFSKPTRIHYNNLLPRIIYNLFLIDVFKWSAIYIGKFPLRNNYGFDFDIFLNGNI